MLKQTHTENWTTPEGYKLSASISPCAWMYPGYGLQIKVDLIEGGGCAYLANKEVKWEEATEADFDALVSRVRLKPCARCGKPAFDPAAHDTNRSGLCESCFMGDLNAEFEAVQKVEHEETARTDADMKAKGYTHRVEAWIHPVSGGDDFQIAFYFEGVPSKASIRAVLKKNGSGVFNDYQIIDLNKKG